MATIGQIEQQMRAQAINAVMNGSTWLTASQITELMKPNTNASKEINEWKARRAIFSICHDGVELFPAYALDAKNNYQPLAVLADLLNIFAGAKDSWGVAFWLEALNSFLGTKSPKDLLQQNPSLVLDAARDAIHGIQHG